MKRGGLFKLVLAVSTAFLFALFQAGVSHFKHGSSFDNSLDDQHPSSNQLVRRAQIQKVLNTDASLSIPFLDKISKFWYVGGEAEIRNAEFIRLTRSGSKNQHGLILSNGMGDNSIDNFETIVKFKISRKQQTRKKARSNAPMGDGIAIVVTPEKDFLRQDLVSSYARKQYEINSGGVMARDSRMMGLPRNLPGLAIIIDTYKNRGKTRIDVPFLDIILNTSPKVQSYHFDTDGDKTTALRLNAEHIKLKNSVVDGDVTQLRLVYLQSTDLLKIDIKYATEGDYWIEIFQTHLSTSIPKNAETNQRYIGISGLTGELTETADILGVETNEFHWKGNDAYSESSKEFADEIELFFIQEYNEKIALEKDDYQRWKMSKSQPNYSTRQNKEGNSPENKGTSITKAFAVFFIIIVLFYLASVYVRVSMKHFTRSKRHRAKSVGLLPL